MRRIEQIAIDVYRDDCGKCTDDVALIMVGIRRGIGLAIEAAESVDFDVSRSAYGDVIDALDKLQRDLEEDE